VLCDLPCLTHLGLCVHTLWYGSTLGISYIEVYYYAFGELAQFGLSYFVDSQCDISLLLAAGSISKKKSDKGLPETLCLMFRRFLILCPIRSISSLTNFCCTEWCIFLITTLYARCCRGWYVWNSIFSFLVCLLLFCDIPICLSLSLCVVVDYFKV
jgi:hypothetical protein